MGGSRGRLARVWRILGWAWRGFWLALLLLLFASAAISGAATRRLERALTERRTKGELLSVEDLVPHVAPGAKNAADDYRRAFTALRLSPKQWSLLLGAPDSLWQTLPKPPPEWSPAEAALAKAAVAANDGYFRLLDEASRLPDCAFPVAWHRGHLTSLLHLPGLVAAGLMLRSRAFFLAEQGRGDDALRICAIALRIADHVQREPDLLSQHHGYRIQALAVEGIAYALRSGGVSAAACRQLSAQLGSIDLTARSLFAMHGEEAIYGLPTFDSARLALPSDLDLPTLRARPWAARLAPEYTLTLDELAYLDYTTRAMDALELPWPAAERAAAELDRRFQRLPDYRGRLTKAVAPPVRPELLHRQVTQAEIGAAQTALALRAYQLRTGRLPASLAAVGALPMDPFTGKPFHYRRQGAGFVVYSTGPDLADDGGRPPSPAALTAVEEHRPGGSEEHYDIAMRG